MRVTTDHNIDAALHMANQDVIPDLTGDDAPTGGKHRRHSRRANRHQAVAALRQVLVSVQAGCDLG